MKRAMFELEGGGDTLSSSGSNGVNEFLANSKSAYDAVLSKEY